MWLISVFLLLTVLTQPKQECVVPLELQFSIEAELDYCK